MGRLPALAVCLLAAASGPPAPAAAQLVRGGGARARDCLAEFAAAAAGGTRRIRCVDNDPACDADAALGACRFEVGVCLNASDPELPGCAPGDLESYLVENVQPDTDPRHVFEFQALQDAVDLLGLPLGPADTDACTGAVAMRLPLEVRIRRGGARYRKLARTLRASARGPGGVADEDALPMACLPAKGADPCSGITSTLDQIERHVFEGEGCSRQTCHNAPQSPHGLALLPGETFAALVGVEPANVSARLAGKLRVDPGRPANSYLVDKLRGRLSSDEGARMPKDLPALPEREIRLVEAWIEAGAPAAGFVGELGCPGP
jgi:hypothetical protein